MTLYDGKSKRKNVLKVADATFRTSVSMNNKKTSATLCAGIFANFI